MFALPNFLNKTAESSPQKPEFQMALNLRAYLCIDLKSFYASVECVAMKKDPLTTNLLVADESRTDKTICLAVSPSLKAIGVPSRPRLFEAKQAIRNYEARTGKRVDYTIAVPHMALYEQVSARIVAVYLRYVSAEDIHVYSIDECFIDCTPYLHLYDAEAQKSGVHPAHTMAMTMIRDVLNTTGITATVGLGTNMYLAKVAMDIVAKKAKPDRQGVRIAELNEESYKLLLWDHEPLTDFWQIGPGKALTLGKAYMFTMGDIARRSLYDEEWFFRKFGIDGEILIDHAWGLEPVTMQDIKNYRPEGHSLSNGQVLSRPYEYEEARLVFCEMVEVLCADLFTKELTAKGACWWVSYDFKSLEKVPNYEGPVSLDFYGRLHPVHHGGTVRFREKTNSLSLIAPALAASFDAGVDHRLLFRRLDVCATDVAQDVGTCQLDFFTDYEALEREKRIQSATLEIRKRYGMNALVKGMNLLNGATTMSRNEQIGGHRK